MDEAICEYPNFIVAATERPFNSGHVVIMPKRRLSLNEVEEEALGELHRILTSVMYVLDDIYKPHGYNIMIGHRNFVVEIVPRWNGDVNFMPIFFNTKVVPELPSQYSKAIRERLC